MTVGELIAKLQTLPQDADIFVWSATTGCLDDPIVVVHDNADMGASVSHIEIISETDKKAER